MIDFDEKTVTDAVLEQIKNTPDKRLLDVMSALVRHLHQFARDVSLTRDEWEKGIEFLTATGKKATPERQEFILLSDTLGFTTLMNLLEDKRARNKATDASVLGPFYRDNPPMMKLGDSVAKNPSGQEAVMYGTVVDANGKPIPGALIDIWLTNDEGLYDVQAFGPGVDDFRARFQCDAQGKFWFRTTQPFEYSIPMDGPVGTLVRATSRAGMRPAHIHVRVMARGYRDLVSALYFDGDRYLDSDAAFGVIRKLVIKVEPPAKDSPIPALPRIRYDFALVRDEEKIPA